MSGGTPADAAVEGNGRSRWLTLLRFALGLGVLLGSVVLVARTFKPQLERLGVMFFERFGLAGVSVGTFLADGFHCPIPPQFYMLLAIASGRAALAIIATTSLGSVLGGSAGFALARRLGKIPRLERWLSRVSRGVIQKVGQRHPMKSVLLLSLTPMAFSVLCYAAGFYRLRGSAFALLLALRVPKLALYYYLVSVGWNGF